MHEALGSYRLTFSENCLLLSSCPSPNNREQPHYRTVSDFIYWTNIIQGEYNVNSNKYTAVFWYSLITRYRLAGHSSPVFELHQNRRIKNRLDATYYYIVLLIGSTCFGHYYAHHQELATMMLITTLVVSFLVCSVLEVRCSCLWFFILQLFNCFYNIHSYCIYFVSMM